MATTTYRVTLADGEQFVMYGDMVQASAGIRANFSDDQGEEFTMTTPYQTANAGHRAYRAAELVAEYYAQPGDSIEVVSVEEL